jgi:hypothetical protein
MNKWLIAALASIAMCGSAQTQAYPLVSLDVNTVTTGGVAVTAINAGHRASGGWIQNPPTATANLCINERGAATTTAGGDVVCIVPGQTYMLSGNAGPVSVVSSDSVHPFSGMGWN